MVNSAIDTPKSVKTKPKEIIDADLLALLKESHLFLKERKRLTELEKKANCSRATLLKVLSGKQFNFLIIKEAYNMRKEIEAAELEELKELKKEMELFKARRIEYQQLRSDVETFKEHSDEYNQINKFLNEVL